MTRLLRHPTRSNAPGGRLDGYRAETDDLVADLEIEEGLVNPNNRRDGWSSAGGGGGGMMPISAPAVAAAAHPPVDPAA